MRLLLLLVIATLSSSCGLILDEDVKEGLTRQHSTTDKVLLPYVVSFEEQAKISYSDEAFAVGDIPVNFGDTTEDRFDGVCIKYPDGTREILLKKAWFDRANEVQREILIFHELGHCRLNRKHNSSETMAYDDQLTVKVSIMNPVVPSSYYYSEYKDAYLLELFHSDTTMLVTALESTNTTEEEEDTTQGGISPLKKGIEIPHADHHH